MIRRLVKACLIIGAFGNAVPSQAQIRPQT
jgi:hypothetical protein